MVMIKHGISIQNYASAKKFSFFLIPSLILYDESAYVILVFLYTIKPGSQLRQGLLEPRFGQNYSKNI